MREALCMFCKQVHVLNEVLYDKAASATAHAPHLLEVMCVDLQIYHFDRHGIHVVFLIPARLVSEERLMTCPTAGRWEDGGVTNS